MNTKVIITAEDQTGAGIASVKSSMAGLGASIGVFSALAQTAIAAIGEMVNQTIGLYKEQINVADSMAEMSVRMGMSIKDLVAWKAAAEMNGTSAEAMQAGVRMLAKHMTEHGEALRKAGIDSKDANGAFLQLSDLFKGMTDPVQRLDLATRLFGRGVGQQLLPVLVQGSDELKKIRETTDGYGEALVKLSPDAQKLNDTLYLMGVNFKAAAAEGVLPLVKDFNEMLLPALSKGSKESSAMSSAMSMFIEPMRAVAVLGVNVAFVFNAMGREIGGIAAQLAALGRGDFKAFSAIGEAMKEDAKQARADFDALEAKMMRAGLKDSSPLAGRDVRDARDRMITDADTMKTALDAARRAKELQDRLSKRESEDKGKAAPKTALQKMIELGERNLAAAKAAEYAAADDDEEARLGANKRAMESARLQKQEKDALEKRTEAIKDGIEPLRVLAREIDEINKLRKEGLLTADEASKAEDELTRKFAKQRESMLDLKDTGKEAFEGIKDTIESMGNQAADTFAEMLTTGKASFSDLINSWIKDIARLQAKQMMDPITKGATSWLSKALGFGGSSTGGAGSLSGNGSVQGLADFVFDLHSGGIAGSGEGSGSKLRSLAMFAGAPRYHGGGLAGDEVPAVLKRGEGVFTPGQMKALGGAAPNVVLNVINQTGQEAKVKMQGAPQFDGNAWVISAVMEAAQTNTNFRAAMGLR